MSWVPSKKRFAQFAILAMMAGEVSYLAAEVLILRSTGPSMRQYRPGQRVADTARFVLRPGDTVVVLAGGGTRTFRGPGTFAANQAPRIGGLASLDGRPRRVREQTGAVRGDGATAAIARPTDFWQFDVSQSGRACIPAGRAPILWRPDAARSVQLTITPAAGTPQTLAWGAGQATLAWPRQVPVVDGASYQLSWPGAAAPVRMTAQMLPALPADDLRAVASAFLARECRGQLDVLIATRQAPDEIAAVDGASPAGAEAGTTSP